jgi:hypothetical protein
LGFLQKIQPETLQKRKDMEAVTIDPEVLKIVINELDMNKFEADKLLRVHGGDLERSLLAFIG